eukprot:Gregarina_sp_Poly_1__1232@NODE_12_length_23383_cov_104_521445_g10_i0_p17_GENE_NODE_12_length_23383_cov_104_521445_g10_i0NODE_12_length_23383_cov_104_521445_g10_i0_p17_ORF_typecomplete_len114_score16_22_NODE_12_length_23383_cov_104_521445_g10_i060576398
MNGNKHYESKAASSIKRCIFFRGKFNPTSKQRDLLIWCGIGEKQIMSPTICISTCSATEILIIPFPLKRTASSKLQIKRSKFSSSFTISMKESLCQTIFVKPGNPTLFKESES